MKIAVIGGGNMGGAIAVGAISQAVVAAKDVTVSHLSEKMRPIFGEYQHQVRIENENSKAISGADIIIIAVKPWIVEGVLQEISQGIDRARQSIISVVAGLSFTQIEAILQCKELGSLPIYRVIPNTAISIGEGVSIISSYNSTPELDASVEILFKALGSTFIVEEEMMTPLTSLSSCGIAFALRYLDASMRAGVEVGVDEKLSLEVSLKTMQGAVAMLQHNGTLPQSEIDKVTTKGGITLKGLAAMEREGFCEAVKCAMRESR